MNAFMMLFPEQGHGPARSMALGSVVENTMMKEFGTSTPQPGYLGPDLALQLSGLERVI